MQTDGSAVAEIPGIKHWQAPILSHFAADRARQLSVGLKRPFIQEPMCIGLGSVVIVNEVNFKYFATFQYNKSLRVLSAMRVLCFLSARR